MAGRIAGRNNFFGHVKLEEEVKNEISAKVIKDERTFDLFEPKNENQVETYLNYLNRYTGWLIVDCKGEKLGRDVHKYLRPDGKYKTEESHCSFDILILITHERQIFWFDFRKLSLNILRKCSFFNNPECTKIFWDCRNDIDCIRHWHSVREFMDMTVFYHRLYGLDALEGIKDATENWGLDKIFKIRIHSASSKDKLERIPVNIKEEKEKMMQEWTEHNNDRKWLWQKRPISKDHKIYSVINSVLTYRMKGFSEILLDKNIINEVDIIDLHKFSVTMAKYGCAEFPIYKNNILPLGLQLPASHVIIDGQHCGNKKESRFDAEN